METIEAAKHESDKDHGHLVVVIIDGVEKKVQAKEYLVSNFKAAVGVAPESVLDEVINGQFIELQDDQHIKIKGGEKFVSHARGGGSS